MPYKIVQTIEDGKPFLTAVPHQWEKDGILMWPKKKAQKLRRNKDSIPNENWTPTDCITKRSNLTYDEAENEIEKMCNNSDTEITDNEVLGSSNKRQKRDIFSTHRDNNTSINFNHLVTQCLENNVPDSEREVICSNKGQNENIFVTTQPTGCNDQNQPVDHCLENNVAAPVEDLVDNLIYITQDQNLYASQLEGTNKLSILEAKIEALTENVKILSHNTITIQKNQQELFETQQNILFNLANISTQIEEIVKSSCTQPDKRLIDVSFKPISDKESFDSLESKLQDPALKAELLEKMTLVCGTRRGKGVNNAYALIDVLFTRDFLKECSWAGGSRSESAKICFKTRKNIINFFFTVVNEADNNFTFLDTQKFLKIILRNSRQRSLSHQRMSVTKNRSLKQKQVNDSVIVGGTTCDEQYIAEKEQSQLVDQI